jgi:hypothetical protein
VPVPVPFAVVTATSTKPVACAGVFAVIVCGSTTTTLVAAAPPNVTLVAPVKKVPVIVTEVPPLMPPVLGETDETVGAGIP